MNLRCVYEAGPCGYELHRQLKRNGIACDIAATWLIPRKPGDRVKTDRRDAVKLGRSYRSGDLTTILGKFLLGHGHRYRDGRAWTNKHSRWLGEITLQDPHTEAVLEEYRTGLDQTVEQLARLTESHFAAWPQATPRLEPR